MSNSNFAILKTWNCFGPRNFSSGATLPQKNTSVQNNHLRFRTMTSKMMVRSYYCLIRPGTLKNPKLVVSALLCKENANLNIISHFQVLKCKILQFDTLKFWWTFHDEICKEIFDNFHRDSGEENHCLTFCSFILPNEAELLRTFVPKMSYFITVGLILSDFVSEESIRPYFECFRDTVLAMFTSKTTNFPFF